MAAEALVERLIESGRLPEPVLRAAIRTACLRRLRRESRRGPAEQAAFLERLRSSAVAEQVETANEQHYEVAADLFRLVLGPRLKYSSCLWPGGVTSIAGAEDAMLALTCERARIEDGMTVLDLGCGWGSLTGWLSERYPAAQILAVSNSRTQREWIEALGLRNVTVLTADVNTLDLRVRFDRIVSVEMLEHVRNYEVLLERIGSWLEPDGRFFCHVFCHERHAYAYEHGWMARRFFTAGTMPSYDLIPQLADTLELEERWRVPGTHYARTAEAWLEQFDENRDAIESVLDGAYGAGRGRAWAENWRVFFLACAELWGYGGGTEWLVGHYRFARRA